MEKSASKRQIDFSKEFSKPVKPEEFGIQSAELSADLRKAIASLQVYQAELEMQNEELREVHEKLESSRNRYFELFNFAPTGYVLLNSAYIIVEANVAVLDLLGLSRTDINNTPLLTYIHTEDHRLLVSLLDTLLSRKAMPKQDVVIRVVTGTSQYRTIKIEGKLADRSEIEPEQIMLAMMDLTELEKTRKALADSENLYRSLVYSSMDHIFMLSSDGYFLTSNQKGKFDHQLHSNQILGQSLMDIFQEEVAQIYQGKVEEINLSRYPVQFEYDLGKGSERKHFLVQLYPIMKRDVLWAIGGICQDVTRLKEVEEQKRRLEAKLRHSQKLESLGNLAGGIAHDFNNILSAILGYSELLLAEVEKGSSQEEDLREIYNGGKRARDLVQQILQFARKTSAEIVPTNIAEVAREVLRFIRSTIPANIEIETEITSSRTILGDPTQVYQVLLNLCTNGYQAMEPEGGKLTLCVRDLTLVADQENDREGEKRFIQIIITDTGCGIEPALVDYIFDPYFTTKQIRDGSGMGLAVVHGIIESYQGTITVESEPGKGSKFIIMLPAVDMAGEKPKLKETLSVRGTESILVVDDEPSIVKLVKQTLEGLGYQVTTSTSSVDALQTFEQDPDIFDLVITDMTMPHLTGDKLAMEILKLKPGIPVILCTGFNDSVTGEIIEKTGIHCCVDKPFIIHDFATTVRGVLDENKM